MFRDEHNAWLMAKEPDSIFGVMGLVRDEAKMPVYFIILRVLSWFTNAPEAPKVLSLLFAGATCALILTTRNLKAIFRIVLLCTFPFAGSYFVFVRDYGLVIFLLAITVRFNLVQRRETLAAVSVDALLALTNLFGFMYAVSQAIVSVVDLVLTKRKPNRRQTQTLLLRSLPLFLAIVFMSSPVERIASQTTYDRPLGIVAREAINKFNNTIFPLSRNPWSAEISSDLPTRSIVLFFVGTILLLTISFAIWQRSKKIFVSFFIFNLLFCANLAFGYAWFWWHFGMHQAVTLVFLATVLRERTTSEHKGLIRRTTLLVSGGFTAILIAANVLGPGATLFTFSNFSNSKQTARAITEDCPRRCLIIVADQDESVSISGYLNSPVFDFKLQKFRSHFSWRDDFDPNPSWIFLERTADDHEATYFVSPVPVAETLHLPRSFKFFKRVTGGIWENYWVYKQDDLMRSSM